ncbi:hypothetical protein [Streptomyces sp. NPDC102264]|uniref:hypothetical protein n=1 Tax=Streptomyces sp. NPDC102264 TaxID=3366149 RepID=UPI00382FA7D4
MDTIEKTMVGLMATWLVPFATLGLTVGVDSSTDAVVTFGAPVALWLVVAIIVLRRTS